MKKRLLGFVLAVCLAVLSVMPAFAAGSDDPEVQASYDAYVAIEAALEAGTPDSVDALPDLLEAFTAANEALDDEQLQALVVLVGAEDEWGLLSPALDAAYAVAAKKAYDEYAYNPNAATALELTKAYTEAKELDLKIDTMVPGIVDAYTEALSLLPSDEVLKVSEAIENLAANMQFPMFIEDLALAMEAFDDAAVLYATFSEEDVEDLAALLDSDKENMEMIMKELPVMADQVYAAAYAYQEFGNNWDVESAKGFMKAYEDIILNEEVHASIKNIIYETYADYDDMYAEAKSIVAEAGPDDGSKDDGNQNESPKTGEPVSMLIIAGVAAAGAAFAGKRRR